MKRNLFQYFKRVDARPECSKKSKTVSTIYWYLVIVFSKKSCKVSSTLGFFYRISVENYVAISDCFGDGLLKAVKR